MPKLEPEVGHYALIQKPNTKFPLVAPGIWEVVSKGSRGLRIHRRGFEMDVVAKELLSVLPDEETAKIAANVAKIAYNAFEARIAAAEAALEKLYNDRYAAQLKALEQLEHADHA